MSDAVGSAIDAALEASIFQAPKDPGLTSSELIEILNKLDFKDGEINDAISDRWRAGKAQQTPDGKWMIDAKFLIWPLMWGAFDANYPANPKAVDFPISYLRKLQRDVGRDKAQITRSDLVAAGMREGISQLDMEVAITLLVYSSFLRIGSDILKLEQGKEHYPLYSATQSTMPPTMHRRAFDKVPAIVTDTIRRRSDGRLPSVDPLVSFESVLEKIGHKKISLSGGIPYRENLLRSIP